MVSLVKIIKLKQSGSSSSNRHIRYIAYTLHSQKQTALRERMISLGGIETVATRQIPAFRKKELRKTNRTRLVLKPSAFLSIFLSRFVLLFVLGSEDMTMETADPSVDG